MSIEGVLERLRRDIHRSNEPQRLWHIQRFEFLELGGHFYLEFEGDPQGDAYEMVLSEISRDPIAPSIASLRMRGPDVGVNGTKNWDLTFLASSPSIFANLQVLHIQQNQPADHNRAIVGAMYDEDGVTAAIARKAPRLTQLTTPSAPDGEFFKAPLRNLEYLNIDAGYATQDFIVHLSQSGEFPRLRSLEWGEYCESYIEGWREQCTPFAHYEALFSSKAFLPVERFVLRNPVCSASELAKLKSLRPDIQFLVVRWESGYV